MKSYLRIIIKTTHYQKHQKLPIDQITIGAFPFLAHGCIRLYAYDFENLKEHTLGFWFNGEFLPSFGDHPKIGTGLLSFEFLEDTTIINIPEKHFLSIVHHFREAAEIIKAYHWEQLAKFIDQLVIRNTLRASGRLQAVLAIQPELVKKAAVKDIASYLGIDERTLSRIRGQK
ncbi:hypothetical protein [Pedobacter sp. UYP30]|uniref:Crp/Fnr family transcriptional regulator n=1 Tax=Pedobacter sp. UYP30 TaxID=1756400 RepID=UPI0033963F3E